MTKLGKTFGSLLLLCALLGCQPNNAAEPSLWRLQGGELLYNNEAVDWQRGRVLGCNACEVAETPGFHPSGPTFRYKLTENGVWRASKVEDFRNRVLLWQGDQPVQLVVSEAQEGKLLLSLKGFSMIFELNSLVDFEYQGQRYQLWVDSFREPETHPQYSNERDSFQISYLLLSR